LLLEPLSPKLGVDAQGPLAALEFVFNDQDEATKAKKEEYLPILNIALTGGYGTGKSSVIETFRKAKHKSFIHLAFTHFEKEEGKKR